MHLSNKLCLTVIASALSFATAPAAYAEAFNADSGGSFQTSAQACASAKRRSADYVEFKNSVVDSYGQCVCAQRPVSPAGNAGKWECNVDVYFHHK